MSGVEKLALGTVQFGLDYGISNDKGQTPVFEVKAILALAKEAGITLLDTAAKYGDSERVLGVCLPPGNTIDIVTKTDDLDKKTERLCPMFEKSLARLKRDNVYGLLVHNPAALYKSLGGDILYGELQKLKAEGLVKKIGISAYTQHETEKLTALYDLDLVQLPLNVLDQQLVASGFLSELKKKNIEIHARSAFLQGVFLMREWPSYFDPIVGHLKRFQEAAAEAGVSPLAAALNYVLQLPEVDRVVVGVNTADQLREIVAAANTPVNLPWETFALPPEKEYNRYVNPALWPLSVHKK